jgi:SpoVK/Ycf46/Vps4 family AAA+-type ATPase
VAAYVGQSALKTRKILANGLEGVVFIDEAYTLTPCSNAKNADTYSEESVGELINFIDKFIGCTVIIVAGYKDKMIDCFLKFNEGMPRRFPKMIELSPYSSTDLFNIFEYFLNDSIDVKSMLSLEQRKYIKGVIKTLNDSNIFNNQAGDMLNLSKIIGEDTILYGTKYNKNMMNLSFKKFCLGKNIAIDIN